MDEWRREFLAQGLAFGAVAGAPGGSATASSKPAMADVRAWGARGDGRSDDTHAIQAALDSLPDGGLCYLPRGDYLVTRGVRPHSATTLCGAGYASRILCAPEGWALETRTNFGLINIDGQNNVRITAVRLYGTKTTAHEKTPKLVYFEDAQGVMVDHCWLEHTAFEGIWNGGSQDRNQGVLIEANLFEDVGFPAGKYVGLPAIQLNCIDCAVTGNRLINVGTGIGASGARIAVTGNVIRSFTVVGIGTGGASESGAMSITGNLIEFESDDHVVRVGILTAGGEGPARPVNVCGNSVRVKGGSASFARCYRHASGKFSSYVGNIAEIESSGIGFEFFGSKAGEDVVAQGNVVYLRDEAKASYGFVGTVNGTGDRLSVRSSGNNVLGFSAARGSFAFDYRTPAHGGTLDLVSNGDFAHEGLARVGATMLPERDRNPMFASSAGAIGAKANAAQGGTVPSMRYADLGPAEDGSLAYVIDGVPLSRPLKAGGGGCLAIRQGGAWVAVS
jgi:hypothetical protein